MIKESDILNANILIVDDEEPNVLLIERLLSGAGYTSVVSTMNPYEVCDLHNKNRYDLILLDINMPGMNGFQVIEGLNEIETDSYLPLIVITADPSHKLRALQAGAKDFVSKPFELVEVLTRVHNMLEVRLLHVESKNYSRALEQTVREVEASRELIRYQNNEVKSLYEAEIKAKNDAEDARRLLLEEHNLLQQALLPVEMHRTPNYSLATRFVPGAPGKYVGGDFYDVFETEDGKTALLIGDVTGKGVEAASLAVAVRSSIRAFAYDLGRPDQALTHANAVTFVQSRFSERFATVFLAILDPQTGCFSYVSAGHPPAMILHSDCIIDLLDTGQLPIGIDIQSEYRASESRLNPGDKLVMYTDGITESRRGHKMYGEDGLQVTLHQCASFLPEDLLDGMFQAAKDISEDRLTDDAAVIIIGRNS